MDASLGFRTLLVLYTMCGEYELMYAFLRNKACCFHNFSKGHLHQQGINDFVSFQATYKAYFSQPVFWSLLCMHQRSAILSNNSNTTEGQVHVLHQLAVLEVEPAWLMKAERPKQAPGKRAKAAFRGRAAAPQESPCLCQWKTSGQRLKGVSLAAQQRSFLSENDLSRRFQHPPWLLLKPFSDKVPKPSRDYLTNLAKILVGLFWILNLVGFFGNKLLARTISVMSWSQSKTLPTGYLSVLLEVKDTCNGFNLGGGSS